MRGKAKQHVLIANIRLPVPAIHSTADPEPSTAVFSDTPIIPLTLTSVKAALDISSPPPCPHHPPPPVSQSPRSDSHIRHSDNLSLIGRCYHPPCPALLLTSPATLCLLFPKSHQKNSRRRRRHLPLCLMPDPLSLFPKPCQSCKSRQSCLRNLLFSAASAALR